MSFVVLSFLALMISNSALEINIPSLFEQLNIAFDDVTTGQKLNKVYHRLAVELIRKDGTSKAFSYPIKVCSASCSGLVIALRGLFSRLVRQLVGFALSDKFSWPGRQEEVKFRGYYSPASFDKKNTLNLSDFNQILHTV